MTRLLEVAVVLLVILAHAPAYGETLVGRWCDAMIPGMPKFNRLIVININDTGVVEVNSKFEDGSSNTSKLKEISGGIFKQIGSKTGDKYRVVPGSGELQLLDNDGLIRTARRLEAKAKARDCLSK
jgi:hypothetical protein